MLQCLINEVMDLGSNSQIKQRVVVCLGVDSIGEKDIGQLIVWVSPYAGTCKSGVAERAFWSQLPR